MAQYFQHVGQFQVNIMKENVNILSQEFQSKGVFFNAALNCSMPCDLDQIVFSQLLAKKWFIYLDELNLAGQLEKIQKPLMFLQSSDDFYCSSKFTTLSALKFTRFSLPRYSGARVR